MKYLKQRHIPMAIATSSYREEIMPTINALGIDEYVDVIVGREMSKRLNLIQNFI